MAGFLSALGLPGMAADAQTVRPGLSVTRYCRSQNCRNGIRLSSEDKLCEQCLGLNSPDTIPGAVKQGAAEDGSSQPQPPRAPRASLPFPQSRAGQRQLPLEMSRPAARSSLDSHAAHLAMLDERQQNRARKLEQETEEIDGRWRTIRSPSAFMSSSPPRPTRSRREDVDRAVTVDSYRPLHDSDPYKPERFHLSDNRPPTSGPEITVRPTNNVALNPLPKRKFDAVRPGDETSNKSLQNPANSTRCGKRNCVRMAMSGKDRCEVCYRAEGRHEGDERRRCASMNCTHCISDAIDGDLCRICMGIELGDVKLKTCSRPGCNNKREMGHIGSLCTSCHQLAFPARKCQRQGCATMLADGETGDHCRPHTARFCSKPSCNNQIASNLKGPLCRPCASAKAAKEKVAKQGPSSLSQSSRMPASQGPMPGLGNLPGYQNLGYMMPYNHFPPQHFQAPQHQNPFPQQMYGQPQPTISPEFFHPQPHQQFNHALPLMMGQPYMAQDRNFGYRNSPSAQPQQIDGRHSSFLTQQFRRDSQPPRSSMPAPPKLARPQLMFDDSHFFSGLPERTQPLGDISSSARRHRVTTMQRMLKAPCLGCLQEYGADEASTHPQIYCVHLPSKVRQTVLLDNEQWTQMCTSGQEAEDGEVDSGTELAGTARPGKAVFVKQEEPSSGRLSPISTLCELQESQERLAYPVMTVADLRKPDQQPSCEVSAPSMALNPENCQQPASPAKPSAASHDSGVESNSRPPVAQGGLCAVADNPPTDWASDSVTELLKLKAEAEPGTPLEVAVSLQQELRNFLLVDVTEGDPQDGEPTTISLLRVLDQRVEMLRSRPSDA